MTDTPTPRPSAASRFARAETDLAAATRALKHIPHPHLARRRAAGPVTTADQLPTGSAIARFNTRVALLVTRVVGSMWCAYAFGGFDLLSLPTAIRGGAAATVSWVAQTFLQLVLLSVIMVGQNVQTAAGDARAKATFDDAEAVLHYVDGHAKSLAQLHAKLDTGMERIHARLDKELLTPALVHLPVTPAEPAPAPVEPTTAAAQPSPAPAVPPSAPVPPAAAPPSTPSSPPADGPTGTGSTP